jgi:hypothetical protein
MKILVKCKQCNLDFLKSEPEIKRSELRGYKNHFCSNKCSREYNINRNKNILPNIRKEEYNKNPKLCLQCQTPIPYRTKSTQIYCSQKCAAIYTQKDGGRCHWSEEDKRILSDRSKTIIGFYNNNPKTGSDINCAICNKLFYRPKSLKKVCCSSKCSYEYIKQNNTWKNGSHGGYRKKGGRGKQGWYKGYYCNSSWELAWVIYQLEHNIKFKRNTQGFQYDFLGKKYKFYPDFILENGDYVEIKAYIDDKNKAKISSFPHKLSVIGKFDILPFIQYTVQKYGKDYIKLYESK